MSRFVSSVLIGIFSYLRLAGSSLVDALPLFLFSLGMGISILFGGTTMAQALPLLSATKN